MKIVDLIAKATDLYSKTVSPVCEKYELTYMEFTVLLFLANNPEYDTATQVAAKRRLTKSHISISVHSLEERGYLSGYEGADRRTIHLRLCGKSEPAISDGRAAQERFTRILFQGFSNAEKAKAQQNLQRIEANITAYRVQTKYIK